MEDKPDVAIVGAGTMGARIAFQCLRSGQAVALYDIEPKALERARREIQGWLAARDDAGAVTAALARLHPHSRLQACLAGSGLVIETAPEDVDLKRLLFAEIGRHVSTETLVATNSSSIPSSRLAGAMPHPERVFNMNFTDPVAGDLLVELMGHADTAPETLDGGEAFVKAIGMVPIVTRREIMGFSFNRVWRAIKREALHLVGDGYAQFEDLDRSWMLSFGLAWGPFGLMDRIGIDVVRAIELQYYRDSGEERDRPPAFLTAMIDAGRLGVKTGTGFYSYPDAAYERPGWLRKQAPWNPTDMILLPAAAEN
jgi:3-hydroxybutyryl-CoA dehydrogenase